MLRCIFQSFSGVPNEMISGGAREFLPPGCFDGQTPRWPVSQRVNGDAERGMQ